MMTVTLTQEAQSQLDRYLRRVKVALRTHPSVDADEVERDVRGHIEAELAELPIPITEDRLRNVLDRLGSPNQWVPTDELSLWRRLLVVLRSGPEDWRLAYVTFALFVAGPLVGSVGPLLFFASVLMARATLALLEEEGEPVGARRWLVYPPLVVTYVVIALGTLIAVPAVIASAGDPSVRPDARAWLPEPFLISLACAVVLGAGLWWTVLGLLLARFVGATHLVFWPFADRLERRHGIRFTYVGVIVAAAAAMVLATVIWRT